MMAYGNTKVPVARSQEQIRRLLLGNSGTGVAFISQPPMEGFEAMMPIEGVTYRIRIQAAVSDNTKDIDQAQRRIWRVMFYHLKSVFEAANTGVMEFREMMLPYIVTKDGQTVAQHILPNLAKAIQGRPDRLLPAAEVRQ